MGNLGFKDTVMSSNLFKLRIYLLELLLILFVYGHLLINKLLHKIFKVGFRLGSVDGGVWRAPKFIATATLFKFMTLENTLLCHKDIVWK